MKREEEKVQVMCAYIFVCAYNMCVCVLALTLVSCQLFMLAEHRLLNSFSAKRYVIVLKDLTSCPFCTSLT